MKQPMNQSEPVPDAAVFAELESRVQSYARSFPKLFDRAEGAYIYDEDGAPYLDFLAGAGSLNYGHNNPLLRAALIDYIDHGGVTHSLDLHTAAKRRFLSAFNDIILRPRDMRYVLQFTGPTGTNAVEAALKLARNVTGRSNVISFTNGFHGVSLGAAAMTGNAHHRNAAGLPLSAGTAMPFCGYMGDAVDTITFIDKMLSDPSSGVDHPAAVILETVQGEGGVNVASFKWLRKIEKLCRKHDMLLIVDDIQAGCGRTGSFFSFDGAGIAPDMVTLSKSLSGYGLPFAVVLIKPEHDRWRPGEHNGTFRGNNHAFVTATAALEAYWRDGKLGAEVIRLGEIADVALRRLAVAFPKIVVEARGRGLMRGLECRSSEIASAITARAFELGLIIETSGSEAQVVKLLPPLTIAEADFRKGLAIIEQALAEVTAARNRSAA